MKPSGETRRMRRYGTKTKCFRYGGRNDKTKGVKARFALHPKGCVCHRCQNRAARRKLYPVA